MEKFQEIATVVEQKELGAGIYDMTLQTKDIAKAARAGPISLCGIDKEKNTIRLVYRVTGEGTGTDEFSKLQSGDTIKILGPLGNGFTVEKGKSAFLIGGGIGVPPMLQLAKDINASGDVPKMQIVMGYRDENTFLLDEFKEQAESFVSSDNGAVGTKGTVVDAIKANGLKADVIYACGPTPMLRALRDYADANDMTCYISMEERMACGIGACLACVCNSKEKDHHSNVNNKRICKEGPVFNAREVEL